jgi:hypothetical protein
VDYARAERLLKLANDIEARVLASNDHTRRIQLASISAKGNAITPCACSGTMPAAASLPDHQGEKPAITTSNRSGGIPRFYFRFLFSYHNPTAMSSPRIRAVNTISCGI